MLPGPSSFFCAVLSLVSLLSFSGIAYSQEVAVQPRILQAVDDARRTTLRGNTHPLALARFDRGAAPASMPLDRMLLVLKRSPEQDAALLRLLDEQQDKSSPNYHKWLTPEEFGQRFGPADADIQAVTGWLEAHGFRLNQVSKGRSVIEFSGRAGNGAGGVPHPDSQLRGGRRFALGQRQRSADSAGTDAGGGGSVDAA